MVVWATLVPPVDSFPAARHPTCQPPLRRTRPWWTPLPLPPTRPRRPGTGLLDRFHCPSRLRPSVPEKSWFRNVLKDRTAFRFEPSEHVTNCWAAACSCYCFLCSGSLTFWEWPVKPMLLRSRISFGLCSAVWTTRFLNWFPAILDQTMFLVWTSLSCVQ